MPDDNSQGQWPSTSGQPVFSPVSPTPPMSAPASNAPKKSRSGLMVVASVIVVLLAAIGTVTYLLLNQPKAPAKVATTADILTSLGNSLKSTLKNPVNSSVLAYKTTNPATVVYRFDSKNWVPTDKNTTLMTFSSSRTATADNKSDYNGIISYLTSHGYSEVQTAAKTSNTYSATQPTSRYFFSKDMVCNLHNNPETVLNGGKDAQPVSYTLRLDCAQLEAFTNNIKVIKPLAEAYSSASANAPIKQPVFGVPANIQASGTKNYMNTKLSIASIDSPTNVSQAEFYQLPDKTWHFFTSAADFAKLPCNTYNTDDLKKAFVGFSCWDTTTNTSSFVEQSQPTFQVVPGSASNGK